MKPETLVNEASTLVNTYLVPFGWKILGAIAVWIVGSWIVRFIAGAFGRMLTARNVDPMLGRYLEAPALAATGKQPDGRTGENDDSCRPSATYCHPVTPCRQRQARWQARRPVGSGGACRLEGGVL